MDTPSIPDKNVHWHKFLNWSLLLPLLTVFILVFLFYHELGFFVRHGIPTEYLRVEILNGTRYMGSFIPIFLISLAMARLFGARIDKHTSGERSITRRSFHIATVFIGLAIIPGLLSKNFTVMWIFFLSTMIADLFGYYYVGKDGRKRYHIKYNSKQLIGFALIILCFCSAISFDLGYFERIFAAKVFAKGNHVLLRKYEEFSIYKLKDSVGRFQIIIEYSPDSKDTLLQKNNEDFHLN